MNYTDLIQRQKEAEKLPGMGYWTEDLFGKWIGTRQQLNPQAKLEVMNKVAFLSEKELDATLAYMDAAEIGIRWMGFAGCRVCGTQLGTCCMVTPDKKWRFPEMWQHYIVTHSVRPDEEFIKDALEWGFSND